MTLETKFNIGDIVHQVISDSVTLKSKMIIVEILVNHEEWWYNLYRYEEGFTYDNIDPNLTIDALEQFLILADLN